MELYRFDSGYAVFGVVFEDGLAVRTAPIANYMRGWHISKVLKYAKSKGWVFDEVIPDVRDK